MTHSHNEIEAIYEQARKYLQGRSPLYEKGIPYLKQAADLGHAKAQYNLGILLHQGAGISQSYTESDSKIGRCQGGALNLSQAQPMPKQINLEGLSMQAGLKFSGCPTQAEPIFESRAVYQEAYRYFELAAQQGHARAYYMLGCYFAFGFCSPSDEHAAHYFRIAADAGVADAQYDFGVCLLNGKGTPKSEEEAVRYFKLASEQGNADAHYNLGICHYHGIGVPVSEEQATHYLELAVRENHPKAVEALEIVMMAAYKQSSAKKTI